MQAFIQKFRNPTWNTPLVLLGACLLAFGLLIPWLGFYYDDWHFIYYASRGTPGLVEVFNYDGHPMSVWSYILAFDLLGSNPLLWHLFALLWRWLAVVVFWLCLDTLWPRQRLQTFGAALLFAIYPLFTLQALPISYAEVWMSFFLLGLSFFLTLQAIRQPEKFWLFTTLAILAKLGHAFTSEYTWGTELMRPLLVWFMLSEKLSLKEKLRETFKICLPYLLIFGAMIGWRAFFVHGGRKAFQAQTGLLTNPLGLLISLPRYIIPDFGLILFSSWYPVFDPKYLDLGERSNLLLLALMAASGLALFAYLRRMPAAEAQPGSRVPWPAQALLIGFSGLLFGLIPAYGAGYSVYLTEAPINARLALGALPGAALMVTALLELLVSDRRTKLVVIAVLAGLLIGWHVRYTNDFRKAWAAQVDFYDQLSWRVPGLAANSALRSDGSIFPAIDEFPAKVAVEGDFPTALAVNVLYGARPQPDGRLPYWFIPDLDAPLAGEHVNTYFAGEPKNSLLFSFAPQEDQCLHLLRPEDAAYRRLPDALRAAAAGSAQAGVDLTARFDPTRLNAILGPQSTDNWCYFYESADLARQKGDWKAIPALWAVAAQKELQPGDGREYLPFVEAALRLNDWQQALDLTRSAARLSPNMGDLYCPLWEQLGGTAPSALKTARNALKCAQP